MLNLSVSLNIVIPFFLYLLAGFLLRKASFLDERSRRSLNKLVTNVGLPALMFVNTCKSDFRHFSDWNAILLSMSGILLIFLGAFLIVPRLVRDRGRAAAVIHSLFRGNTSIYGIPIAQGLLGPRHDLSGVLAIIALSTILYNILGILTLTALCKKDSHTARNVVLRLVTTPMLIGTVLGTCLSLLGITMPVPVMGFASGIAGLATPIAFLCLGASFQSVLKNGGSRICLTVAAIRLLAIPALFLGAAVLLFGFRGAPLAALLAVFATPCAINTYPLASAYGADDEIAGGILLYTTAGSIPTIFAIVCVLNAFGML